MMISNTFLAGLIATSCFAINAMDVSMMTSYATGSTLSQSTHATTVASPETHSSALFSSIHATDDVLFSGLRNRLERIVHSAELILSEVPNATNSSHTVVDATKATATVLLLAEPEHCLAILMFDTPNCSSGSEMIPANQEATSNTANNEELEALKSFLKDFFMGQKLAYYAIGGVVVTFQIIDVLCKLPGLIRSIRQAWEAWV